MTRFASVRYAPKEHVKVEMLSRFTPCVPRNPKESLPKKSPHPCKEVWAQAQKGRSSENLALLPKQYMLHKLFIRKVAVLQHNHLVKTACGTFTAGANVQHCVAICMHNVQVAI